MPRTAYVLGPSLAAALAACSSIAQPDGGPGDGAAPDGLVEAGVDAGELDARPDADASADARDARVDARVDGVADVTRDALPDVTPDVRSDVMAADAGAESGSCHLPVSPDDALSSMRAACSFAAGARVADTVADPATIAAARAAIRHVIILTQENHSVDNYFGTLGHGIEGFPAGYSNTNAADAAVPAHHLATPCPCDQPHSKSAMLTGWDNGAMDGWARTTTSPGTLGYYTEADLPFYSWLITTFATSDRYFSAVLDATGPNRRVLYDATNKDVWHMTPSTSTFPPRPSIFADLEDAGISWADYANGTNTLEGIYGPLLGNIPNAHPYTDFVAKVNADNPDALEQVIFIDAGADEHPSANIHQGERFMHDLFALIFAHPSLWSQVAVLFTYDEGGGFFDHVPPPSACVPTANSYDSGYDHFGVRVPIFVVSPYARPGYVSHRTHSHTSILRFLEALYDMPALTARDANADAMLDLFDFGCPSFATPPGGMPAAGTSSCTSSCAQ